MARARLSTKGQLIIPKEIRTRHGWGTGTELVLEDRSDALVIRAATAVRATQLEDVLGCLRFKGKARSLADMEKAIAEAALESR